MVPDEFSMSFLGAFSTFVVCGVRKFEITVMKTGFYALFLV
jgi:hypothetical protein